MIQLKTRKSSWDDNSSSSKIGAEPFAGTVGSLLKEESCTGHPGGEIVGRDRSGIYAEAARKAAP